ncbi:MAG: GH3 auxin-responsive promoter family protein [Cyanobacteria bacterium P01_A01_bin.37]
MKRFHDALDNPRGAQDRVLADVCDRLMASEYGEQYGIRGVDDWERLPIVDYEDIEPWVTRQICYPNQAILTPDPVLFCEKTSGSRGAAKLIPYTQGLRQSFSHLFCIWAHDLIGHGPTFSTGQVYFCVSPTLAETQSPQVPTEVGERADRLNTHALQDDSDYLNTWLQWVLTPFLVMVPQLGRLRSAEEFKEALCLKLLSEPRLETLSIWSPSFLTVHLAYIQRHRHRLIQLLGNRISSHRRDALMADPISWIEVWPQLKLISCWDSAGAADQANHVRSHVPGVYVQGKGLLATEAPITVPLIQAQRSDDETSQTPGYVPLLDEVFFEFEPVGDGLPKTVCRLHDLNEGQEYSIIVSQKGGLYRYRMGDRVRVTHRHRNTPCLEFLGRDQSVSDMVGEKLNSNFVAEVLTHLSLDEASFKSLVPVSHPQPHYVLLLDRAVGLENVAIQDIERTEEVEGEGEEEGKAIALHLAHELEMGLCRAYHYHHARLLGQLAPAQVYIDANIAEHVIQRRLQSGQCWGDMKHSLLETRPWLKSPLNLPR